MNRITSLTLDKPTLSLTEQYRQVRQVSHQICQPLAVEDYIIQSMADVSPPKWHLAHTTWFFETFLLVPYLPEYQVFHPKFGYLFNSYYEGVGKRHPRPQRGLLSRPTVDEVYRYREYVDREMFALLSSSNPQIQSLIILGLHHEQQHQELLLTDIKHIFAINPLRPAYMEKGMASHLPKWGLENGKADIKIGKYQNQEQWLDYPRGLYSIGYEGREFAFDNESPRHQTYLQDYWLANRLVTNGEYLEFMEAGGYSNPEYWLSEGWTTVKEQGWLSPLYWEKIDGNWWIMTLSGLHPIDKNEPVCHVSFYEADAYARFRGKRLPTEAEWEVAASQISIGGNFWETGILHPTPAVGMTHLDQMFGDVWEWTQSAYLPYPGFQPAPGAVGEYNGKFMCNQMVLRGGSCVTPANHIRLSYRNFFPTGVRWQFTGIRLAE